MALTPEEAFKAKVMDVTGVSALVNGYGIDQVKQDTIPPFLVARVTDGRQINHLSGQSGYWTGTISLFIVGGKTYDAARNIGEIIRKGINTFGGNVTVGADTEHIDNLFCDREESASFDTEDGSGVLLKAWQQDWKMLITQPTT